MQLSDLVISEAVSPPLTPSEKRDKTVRVADNKRYIITADPYDKDTIDALQHGQNVYTIYDRLNHTVSSKIWTTKLFDDFVEWFLKGEATKLPFVVSRKFINANGRPCNLGEANPGSEPSKRYNDSF